MTQQTPPRGDRASYRREALIGAVEPAEPVTTHDGAGRVRLKFLPSDKEFRVPPGVSVFDAASWNGIAVDSTCGGHGTCKKCKVRVISGSVPISRLARRRQRSASDGR